MHIRTLELFNFRSYTHGLFEPCAGVTVLFGLNAQGKTNVLEAIYLCCTGRSHRTSHDREMIRWGQDFFRVKVDAEKRDGSHQVEIAVPKTGPRKIKVGAHEISRSGELMGHVTGVLFSPEDLQLVKEGPAERRRFVDISLSQIRPEYYYALQRYARALKQRNELLKNPQVSAALLDPWDEQLAQAGSYIMRARRNYLLSLADCAVKTHKDIASEREMLSVEYAPSVSEDDTAEAVSEALFLARQNDIRRMTTTVGPHRDDVRMAVGGRELRSYGSQGQQRTAALSIRLAELDAVRAATGEAPVLLLDDVMSELDPDRRRQLLARLEDVQTVVTCTDMSDLAGANVGKSYRVEAATLTEM